MSNGVFETALAPQDASNFAAAANALGGIVDATIVAMVFVDGEGRPFTVLHPGVERDVADMLAAADWALLCRLVEEHVP